MASKFGQLDNSTDSSLFNLLDLEAGVILGSGGRAKVYADTSNKYALKIFCGYKGFAEEVDALKKFAECDTIISMITHFEDPPRIVLELCVSSLRQEIPYARLDPKPRFHIYGQALIGVYRAIEYIHGLGYVHTDIKPANILLRSRSPIALILADVDSAHKMIDCDNYESINDQLCANGKPLDNPPTCARGTIGYLAPELVCKKSFGKSSDIWSMFCVVFETLTGEVFIDVDDANENMYGSGDDVCDRDDICDSASTDSSADSSAERADEYASWSKIVEAIGPPPLEYALEYAPGYFQVEDGELICPQDGDVTRTMVDRKCKILIALAVASTDYTDRCTAEEARAILERIKH